MIIKVEQFTIKIYKKSYLYKFDVVYRDAIYIL